MGRVIDPTKRTRFLDATVTLQGEVTSLNRLYILTNHLGVLARLLPDLQVLEITAEGTFEDYSYGAHREFELGTFKLGTAGSMKIDWVYDNGPRSLASINDQCASFGFNDVSISRLVYMKDVGPTYEGYDNRDIPRIVRLCFIREAIRGFGQLVYNGNPQPMSTLYTDIRLFADNVKDKIPKESHIGGLGNSYLKLLCFYPADANVLMTKELPMKYLQESSGMRIYSEKFKPTKVKDVEFKP